MNTIEEQILNRKKNNTDMLAVAFSDAANVLMNKSTYKTSFEKENDAIKDILRYYKINTDSNPSMNSSFDERLDFFCKPNGLIRRNIKLKKGWYKDSAGAFLTITKDGYLVALIQDGQGRYYYKDERKKKNKKIYLNSTTEKNLEENAISFYKSLPLREITIKDILKYIKSLIRIKTFIGIIIFNYIAACISVFIPTVSNYMFSYIVPNKSTGVLLALFFLSLNIIISRNIFYMVRDLLTAKISTYINGIMEVVSIERVLSLPDSFFSKYSAGELAVRVNYMTGISATLLASIMSIITSLIMLLPYTYQIVWYAPTLYLPSMLIIIASGVIMAVSSMIKIKLNKKIMGIHSKINGMVYSIVTGIQKIRLAGAENRVFSRWLNLYTRKADLQYNPPFLVVQSSVLLLAFSLFASVLFQYLSYDINISVGKYYAFLASFGLTSGAFTSFIESVMSILELKPAIEMVKPILDTKPEYDGNKPVMDTCKGNINISHVSFRYSEDTPYILNNFSLTIKKGEYLAIVGKTGCGKSTLLRLMLGFEKPEKGTIYYDDRDMQKIDIRSIRRHIGTVIQNGKLFAGDIGTNILVSAKKQDLSMAWDAAKLACIDKDIKEMPMGMRTIISEGSGGISGGQKQRILIARALVNKPEIIFFDEATSALDNITQKEVFESIATLNATRVVVAHRLSTIRKCDRIIYLEDGKIAEEGTYDELMEKGGKFKELVLKQKVDV